MNLLLTFTSDISLRNWNDLGILNREISLYKKLIQKNVKIHFLTYGDKSDLEYSELLGNIEVIPCLDFIKSKIPKMPFFKRLLLPFTLRDKFKKIDIFKTNQVHGSSVAWISKLLYRKKLIVRAGFERLHSYIIKTKRKGLKNYMKYLINYFLIYISELIAYKLADIIILTSDREISFNVKCFKLKRKLKKNKILHFYNFIDINLFKPLNIHKKDKHILFIGRFSRQKNLINLIRAFKDLKDFSLDFIGWGPDENELIELSSKLDVNLNILGVFPNNEIPKIINQYEIFILPSHWEGNPKVLLEAMSCGIACIGANIQGINNIIEHRANGFICERTSQSIKEAILTVYNDKDLMQKIAINARNFIIDNCSLDIITKKEYALYKRLLQK